MIIDKLLEASSEALNGGDEHRMGRCPEFIEEWVPQIVTELDRLYGENERLKRELALTQSQLLEAEAKIEELE